MVTSVGQANSTYASKKSGAAGVAEWGPPPFGFYYRPCPRFFSHLSDPSPLLSFPLSTEIKRITWTF
jgi:hypothetical protein